MNWDQKLVQLDANECDCVWSGMTILDSMKEAGYVLSAPYYDNTQVIMVKEGSDIKSSADLAGKVVAVQLGTSGEALLADGGDLADLKATFADHLRQLPEVLHRAGRRRCGCRDRGQACGCRLCREERGLHGAGRGSGR